MRRFVLLWLALSLLVVMAAPAGAITRGGSLDGEDHPYVGLMVAQDADGGPLWRCSGSLISPTVFVTAGHCTESPAALAEIWFDTDVESGIPANGYPVGGPDSYSGVTHTYPLYNPAAFYLYDLGLVELSDPVYIDEYAQLPDIGVVDTLKPGRKSAVVTAVGYGLQAASVNPVHPEKTVAERIRMQAELMVVDTHGVAGIGNLGVDPPTNSMILSGDAAHGGTCFGDSGGPMLLGQSDTLVAVNSFGLNGNCAGVGGAYRIDRAEELDWISGFLH
jgi:hypothetical protein